jgi:glycosyltransferase involved in cell wall biosynthesis
VRVGISLLTLVPGISGGSETYARELVRGLGRLGHHEYRVFLPTIADDVDGLPAEVIGEYHATRSTPGRMAAMARGWFAGGRVARRFAGLDAVHFPLTVAVPRISDLPTATTILDVQHETLPQFFSRAERAYRRVVYARSARESERVITISRHAAAAIVEHLGVPAEKVRPIHLGLDHELFKPGDDPREDFLLYPARGWPHKNHARLFQAFTSLRETRPQLRLVLTGGGLERLEPVPDGVEILGEVSSSQLASLYRRAACLVYPSLYEGFGIPPLEAMACGCPVAASNAGAISEVCGDAAVLFDPTDVEAMAAAMLEVDTRRDELTELGLKRAAQFTWDETARRHEDVYRTALSATPAGSSTTE